MLPEEYAYFASAWDSTEIANKTLENLTARLIAEEMRINARNQEEKGVAFKTEGRMCYKCNKMGHLAKNCITKQNSAGKQVRCFRCNKIDHIKQFYRLKQQLKTREGCSICKKTNHTEKTCYFRKNKNKKNKDEEKVSFLTSKIAKVKTKDKISFMTTELNKGDTWIVDSGTTANMTNKCENIVNFKKINTKIAVAKINESMTAKGTDSMEYGNCKLKEVVYISDLSTNLLSVHSITNSGGEVLFTEKEVKIN